MMKSVRYHKRQERLEKRKERLEIIKKTKKPEFIQNTFFLQDKSKMKDIPFELKKSGLWTTLEDRFTGLAVQPRDGFGFNWMTLICLKKKRCNFPTEVMLSINAFLNWIPAGCWNKPSGCICGSMYIFRNRFEEIACSQQCFQVILAWYNS